MKDATHKHTVVMTYEVDAVNWEAAVEQVLRTDFQHLTDCRVRRRHGRLYGVNSVSLAAAAEKLKALPQGE